MHCYSAFIAKVFYILLWMGLKILIQENILPWDLLAKAWVEFISIKVNISGLKTASRARLLAWQRPVFTLKMCLASQHLGQHKIWEDCEELPHTCLSILSTNLSDVDVWKKSKVEFKQYPPKNLLYFKGYLIDSCLLVIIQLSLMFSYS